MTPTKKEIAISVAKALRKEFDAPLQALKDFRKSIPYISEDQLENKGEVYANAMLSIRHIEDGIMRLGMVLKNIGTPDPYPESRNPESTVVEPTADGLKL